MKNVRLFICYATLLINSHTWGQACDSTNIRLTQIQNYASAQWINQYLDIDSFGNHIKYFHERKSWGTNPSQWKNSSKEIYAYDSLSRLIQKDYFAAGNPPTWAYLNQSRTTYQYDSASRIIQTDNFSWNGIAYTYAGANAPRIANSYSVSGRDSIQWIYSWNGNALVPSSRLMFSHDMNDSLVQIETDRLVSQVWNPESITNSHWNIGANSASRIDTDYTWQLNHWQWRTIYHYSYDSLGNILISDNVDYIDNYGYRQQYTYICGDQVSTFSGSSHGGSSQWYSELDGYYTYSNCNPIYKWWHAEDNGTYDNNHQVIYAYTNCNSIAAFTADSLDICLGDSVTLVLDFFGGTPPYSIQWSPATGLDFDSIRNPKASPSLDSWYTVTITDSNGVSISDSTKIKVDALPLANISVLSIDSISTCQSAVLIADSNYNCIYSWYYNGIQISDGYNTSRRLIINRNGTFVLKLMNNQGCVSYDSLIFQEFSRPSPDVTISQTCHELIASSPGSIVFQWYAYSTAINGATSATLSISSFSAYKVLVTDSNGCQNYSQLVSFGPLYANISTSQTCKDSCNGALSVTVYYGNPPYHFQWSSGDTLRNQTNMCPGFYWVTVTDSRGCTRTDTDSIRNNPPLVFQVSASSINDSTLCNGIAFTSLSDQSYNFLWSDGSIGSITHSLCSGQNFITISTSHCTQTDTFTVNYIPNNNHCLLGDSIRNPMCPGDCNGRIELRPSGVAPFGYLWIPLYSFYQDHSSYQLNLCAGNYQCVMIDSTGCVDTLSQDILDPDSTTATFQIVNANYAQPCSTLVQATVIDGTAQSLEWCTGAPGDTASLCPGNCTLYIVNSNGCLSTASFIVPDSSSACVPDVTIQQPSSYLACDGSLSISPRGIPPFNFQWQSGGASLVLDSLCPGTYYFTLSDSTGCSINDSVIIVQPAAACSVSIVSGSGFICQDSCGASFTAMGVGISPFHYEWSNLDSTASTDSLCAGLYSVTMTDSVGCIATNFVIVNPPTPLAITTQAIGTSCIGCANGELISVASGGLAPYYFLVSPSGFTCDTCLNIQAGIYTVCVTDSNHCTTCISDTVFDDPTGIQLAISGNHQPADFFPNPFTDESNLVINPEVLFSKPELSISDLAGQEIFSFLISSQRTILLRNNLSAGIYFYKICAGNKNISVGKLVILD